MSKITVKSEVGVRITIDVNLIESVSTDHHDSCVVLLKSGTVLRINEPFDTVYEKMRISNEL